MRMFAPSKSALLALALLAASCHTARPASIPLATRAWPAAEVRAQDLLILLPGRGDQPTDFERRGLIDFINAERRQGRLSVDVLAVDAHWGYYANRSLPERLGADVIAPALRAGYERIHLFGISLGGFGALVYWRKHVDDITSLTLLAPFLGEDAHNEQGPDPESEASLLNWLLQLPREHRDRIWLGFGEADDFAAGNRRLATALDPSHVLTTPGGHTWSAWQQLWPTLLPAAVRSTGAESSTSR